ncbi:MAG: Rne/Rng family ribonuclease [Nitrospirota bacterium]
MALEIIINATGEETRVAFLEAGEITELYIDRKRDRGIAGNIYKGKVIRVLPGMQAAFVDIGLEKAAFLYVSEVSANIEEYAKMMEDETDEARIEFESDTVEAVKAKKASAVLIEDLLQEGQEIMVQVIKEPIGTKGPRVTTYITLPGRYLVYMPTIEHIGISRRIEEEAERKRLRELINRLKKPGAGYIIRTVSEGVSNEEFKADIEFLELLWQNIQQKRDKLSAPSLLHTDLDIVFRVVRDLFTPKVDKLVVDSKQEYMQVKEFIDSFLPMLSSRVELYEKDEPIFDAYEVEIEISRALGRKVWLKSGGYIVIDHTEALTAIDVNTGRYVGKRNPEETILKTNLEAVKEIAYQLRLRNIGGIIIIDFIDMLKEKNRKKVFNVLQEALANDKARTNILQISELGLVEMSRKRTREDLLRALCEPCSYCEGRSYLKSPTTICYEIFREIRRSAASSSSSKIMVTVNSSVANLLYDEERQGIDELENRYKKKIIIKADPNLHLEQYDIVFI